jgi:hypothetical protein
MSEYYFIRQRGEGSPKGGIPDDFVNRAIGHFQKEGAPFLQVLKNPKHEIYVDAHNILHLGEPLDHFPEVPTWREFYTQYEGYSHEELEKNLKDIDSRLSEEELDDQVYAEWFYDQLAHNYLPAARCAHLIDQLKLDTDDPKAGDVLGSLKRYEGSFTGSDVLYVELTEPITASWLQWALIEAGEPANIHKL